MSYCSGNPGPEGSGRQGGGPINNSPGQGPPMPGLMGFHRHTYVKSVNAPSILRGGGGLLMLD
ncbi:hypothetical protein BGX29_007819 [Mortierella sp. GBA35]|nr:hypothetical protein BGX29_007819 [Mortierella sp. GBA35]